MIPSVRLKLFRPPSGLWLAVAMVVAAPARGQDKKPGAIRLPDGTIVFYTANPGDAAPKIDGVLLSAKEYQQLADQAEQLRKLREAAKPMSPSVCTIRGRVEVRGGRSVVKLTVEYAFRTSAPRSVVLLGGQRAAPVSAAGGDGKVPLLELTADGLAVVAEQAGEQKVTLELEAAVAPRGSKNEVGFEVGLPRAAITTLSFEPPGPTVKKLTVDTRTPDGSLLRPADVRRTADDAARYAGKGVPLGPIDLLEVAWESPTGLAAGSPDAASTADADVVVRAEEARIETTTRLRLRGPAREWAVQLARDATVSVSRVTAPSQDAGPAIATRPDGKDVWTILTPEAGEWLVTATFARPRPDPKDAKYPGPYPVAVPFAAGVPKQTGTVRVLAPVSARLSNFRPSAELRRQDVPPGPDQPAALFKYATAADRPPTLDFEARPARGSTTVQSHHRLDLTRDGWRLLTELRVSPRHAFVEQLTFDLPAGWTDPHVPDARVDEVQVGPEANGRRAVTILLANGLHDPFTLTVDTRFDLPAAATEASLPLPRFTGVTERDPQLTVTVPDGLTVRGSAGDGTAPAVELLPAAAMKPGAAVPQLTGTFRVPPARVDLAWQAYRAELTATVRADVTLGERQMSISETIQLKAVDAIGRPVQLTGPLNPLAFRAEPDLKPAAGGVWTLTPSADAKELTVTIAYAVPLPPRAGEKPVPADVPLLWPDATKTVATVRVWGAARRPAVTPGVWEERPPEPTADRDALPWLTLGAAGSTKPLPLALELSDLGEPGGVVVERAAYQWVALPDGAVHGRARFLLKRWPPHGIELEVDAAGGPTVFVNKDRADNLAALTGDDAGRAYRVPLPESKPSRPTLTLEVQFTVPPQPRGELTLRPPRIRGAVLQTPAWWAAAVPTDVVPLAFGRSLGVEQRWGWRGGLPSPVAAVTPDELDRWFAGGVPPADADPWAVPAGDGVTGRQAAAAPILLVRVPRSPFVIGCSLVALILGLGVSRLRPRLVGPAVAAGGLLAVAAGVGFPQPAAATAAAGLPGVLAFVVLLGVWAAYRWLARRRITHLPTFRREAVADGSFGSGSAARGSRTGTPLLEPATSGSVRPPQPAS